MYLMLACLLLVFDIGFRVLVSVSSRFVLHLLMLAERKSWCFSKTFVALL